MGTVATAAGFRSRSIRLRRPSEVPWQPQWYHSDVSLRMQTFETFDIAADPSCCNAICGRMPDLERAVYDQSEQLLRGRRADLRQGLDEADAAGERVGQIGRR